MKTILVLAVHPELADAMRAELDPGQYRIVHRVSVEDAEPLLVHGLADVCVLDLELSGVQGVWQVEKVRRKAPGCPLLVYAGSRQPDWEEEAYLKGVRQVLFKPFRSRLLDTILASLFAAPAPAPALPRPTDTAFITATASLREAASSLPTAAPGGFQSLEILRNFSSILTHSLNAEALLRQFLLMIREITGVNRAAIFLRPPAGSFLPGMTEAESRQLSPACAIGLSPALLDSLRLSFDSGIGRHVQRLGRILRRTSPDALDPETQQEFETLGAQVAVPILDREKALGIAVFDARVTGEPLVNTELELIFHLLEQVGLAVKNIWLHDQVAGNHAMLADVMRELGSACVVVSRDLAVLHANKMARKFFAQAGSRSGEVEFSDLPAALGSKVFQVLKTGSALAPFKFSPEAEPGTVWQVTISPVHPADSPAPASALMIVEDRTQSEQLHKLERESALFKAEAEKAEQRRKVAERLAAEIGNALMGPRTVCEMFDSGIKDPDSQKGLKKALVSGVTRIERRKTQLVHVAREGAIISSREPAVFPDLVKQAYDDALLHLGEDAVKGARLKLEKPSVSLLVRGDAPGLRFALMEILLNGLQAGGSAPLASVQLRAIDNALELIVADNGSGFTAEAAKSAGTPFWTEKVVGLGLGLYVARKIVEAHGGQIEIVPPQPGQPGQVRLSLPAELAPAGPLRGAATHPAESKR
jgi:signal transduction histidine kinase/CheY-like chemotaxis protein